MNENIDLIRIALKQEMKMAIEQFKLVYKKTSKGIENIYTEANLTNDINEVKKLHAKFFGYLTKSKNSKDKWGEDGKT